MQQETLEETNTATCIATISTHGMSIAPIPNVLEKYKYTSPYYNRINITVIALWFATPFLSAVSVAAVCVAVSTNQWLLTQENIKNENYTGRGDHEYFPKNTISGLWTLCYTNPGKQEFFCSNIEYFPKEEYSPDLKDSTMAIPYTVTKSASFFILSTFLLFVGEFCCLCGHYSRQRRLLTFVSGVIFIISGLLMLIGLVMYISIFKAEIGGKLRPTSQLQPAVFTYKYGYSFILYVTGFVSTEISGTCAVFLYIYWHQKDWRKKGYNLKAKFITPATHLDADPVKNLYSFYRRHPHNLSYNNTGCLTSERISENFTPELQRRFFLDCYSDTNSDDEYPSPVCLKHSLSCNIVNDFEPIFIQKKQSPKIGTDNLNNILPPFPLELCHHHLMSAYADEFITRNCFPKDVSTNTVSNWEEVEAYCPDTCSLSTAHDHDFIPFDLEENTTVPLLSNCIDLENCLERNEFIFETLSKTTPV